MIKKNLISYSLGWSVATMPTLLVNMASKKYIKNEKVANILSIVTLIGGTIYFGNEIKKSLMK